MSNRIEIPDDIHDGCDTEIARLRKLIEVKDAWGDEAETLLKDKTAEIARLCEENERLRDDLAEAVSILYECSTLSAHYDQTRKRLRSFLRRQDPDA